MDSAHCSLDRQRSQSSRLHPRLRLYGRSHQSHVSICWAASAKEYTDVDRYMLVQGESFGAMADPMFWLKVVALAVSVDSTHTNAPQLTGMTAQTLLVAGTQRVSGGIVSLLGYSQVPMGLGMQIAVFGDMPNILGIVGMVIIIAAGLYTVVSVGHCAYFSADH